MSLILIKKVLIKKLKYNFDTEYEKALTISYTRYGITDLKIKQDKKYVYFYVEIYLDK